MDNQREESLDLCSDEQLEQLIKNIHNEIKKWNKKLYLLNLNKMKRKLIDFLNLTPEDLTNVTNFEVFCKLEKSWGTSDEYSHTFSGNLKLSYDYNQIQSEKSVSISKCNFFRRTKLFQSSRT